MAKEKKAKVKPTAEYAVVSEKNDQLVKAKRFSLTKFIIEIFAAAMLITFGVIIVVKKEEAQFAILLITGCVAVLAALIRVFPLLRSLQTKQAKIISFIDILIHALLGGYIIFTAFYFLNNPEAKFSTFNNDAYHYYVAVLLYTRAISFFWVTVIYKEKTTKFNFWVHIAAITISVIFAAVREMTPYMIAIALATIAFIAAVGLSFDAGSGFHKYRKSIKNAKTKEEIIQKEEDIKEAPAVNDKDIIDEIDPATIPVEEPVQDSNIIS